MNSKRQRIDKSREQRWVMMMKAFLILKSRASKTYLYHLCLGCQGQHRFASLLSRLANGATMPAHFSNTCQGDDAFLCDVSELMACSKLQGRQVRAYRCDISP